MTMKEQKLKHRDFSRIDPLACQLCHSFGIRISTSGFAQRWHQSFVICLSLALVATAFFFSVAPSL